MWVSNIWPKSSSPRLPAIKYDAPHTVIRSGTCVCAFSCADRNVGHSTFEARGGVGDGISRIGEMSRAGGRCCVRASGRECERAWERAGASAWVRGDDGGYRDAFLPLDTCSRTASIAVSISIAAFRRKRTLNSKKEREPALAYGLGHM